MAKPAAADKALARSLRVLADRLDNGKVTVLDWRERSGTVKVAPAARGAWVKNTLTGRHTLTVQFQEKGEG